MTGGKGEKAAGSLFTGTKRLLVKIGTNALLKDNAPDRKAMKDLARALSALRRRGVQCALVSSGAMGFGCERLALTRSALTLPFQQASAAVGQVDLMAEYAGAFGAFNQRMAQLLVTGENFRSERALANLRATVETLFGLNVIPVFNENDPVSTVELDTGKLFSDNDGLAVLVALHLGFDGVVFVSDVGGLYEKGADGKALRGTLLKEVTDVSSLDFSDRAVGLNGKGGLVSKLAAIGRLTGHGIPVALVKKEKDALEKVFAGNANGTVFLPVNKRAQTEVVRNGDP